MYKSNKYQENHNLNIKLKILISIFKSYSSYQFDLLLNRSFATKQ